MGGHYLTADGVLKLGRQTAWSTAIVNWAIDAIIARSNGHQLPGTRTTRVGAVSTRVVAVSMRDDLFPEAEVPLRDYPSGGERSEVYLRRWKKEFTPSKHRTLMTVVQARQRPDDLSLLVVFNAGMYTVLPSPPPPNPHPGL